MKITYLTLSGLLLVAAALSFGGCTKGADSDPSTEPDAEITSNACYRSPSDTSYILACAQSFDGSTPAWISGGFKCVDVDSQDANYYEFATTAAPNHKSRYYSTATPAKRENAMPPGTSANPNQIIDQSYVVQIPKNPALRATPLASGYDLVGVAANGVAIFNNQAAPGDSLANELVTMDYGNGHPTNVGAYHYHIEPCYLSNNDGNLVGLMRDGFPVFGRKEADGGEPVYNDSCTHANATSVANCRPYPVEMPNFHCHAVAGWTGPVCHYHVTRTDPFIIEYYAGTPGSLAP